MAVVSEFALHRAMALTFALAVGLALGALFFGGLWLTVQSSTARQSPFLFLASFLVRSAVLLSGLWWIGEDDFAMLVACGIGVLATRFVLTRRLRTERGPKRQQVEVE